MNKLTNYWLARLCVLIKGATNGVVFSITADNTSTNPIAFWPENSSDIQYASPAVKAVLLKKQCVLLQKKSRDDQTGQPLDIVACPLFVSEKLHSVVVIRMSSRIPSKQHVAMQQVEHAASWFDAITMQYLSTEKSQLVTILEIVASCLEHERFQSAATDVVTDLTNRISCDRISIGFLHKNGVKIEAVSHSGGFDHKSGLVSNMSEAMLEAMDQDDIIIFPATADTFLLTHRHAILADEHKIGTILTVPFVVNGKISGAMLAERADGHLFEQATIEHFKQISSMVGPVLEIRRRDEQWLPQKIGKSIKNSLIKIFGPGYISQKIALVFSIFCLIFLTFASGNYRITSDARLEPLLQRVVVAPQNCYIAKANVRPGDIIRGGDILAILDDRDLKLEYQKWFGQLEQLQTEHRAALAGHNRAKVVIIKARMQKAKAQLGLVSEQLSRTRLVAPFNGLIVSGDLSQVLGSPVERGQVLFTVAPLDGYRIIINVDERDIGKIKKRQHGNLILASMPGKPFLFTVETITPFSIAQDGRNYFHVEAEVEEQSKLLRPGMEGIVKINVDRRKLIWIWSHKLIDWLRLFLWTWLP